MHRIFIRGERREYVIADSALICVQVHALSFWLDVDEHHPGFAFRTGGSLKCNRRWIGGRRALRLGHNASPATRREPSTKTTEAAHVMRLRAYSSSSGSLTTGGWRSSSGSVSLSSSSPSSSSLLGSLTTGGSRSSSGSVSLSSSSSSSSSSLGSRGGIVLRMMVTSLHSAAEKFSGMRWVMSGSLLECLEPTLTIPQLIGSSPQRL